MSTTMKVGPFTWRLVRDSDGECWDLVRPEKAQLTFWCVKNCGGAGRKIGGINQYQCGRKRCKCTFRKVDQDDRATTHDLLKWAKELLMAHGYGNVAISVRAAMPGIPDVPITPALLMERGTGKTRTHYDHMSLAQLRSAAKLHLKGNWSRKSAPEIARALEEAFQ